jgi:hypothetical protein
MSALVGGGLGLVLVRPRAGLAEEGLLLLDGWLVRRGLVARRTVSVVSSSVRSVRVAATTMHRKHCDCTADYDKQEDKVSRTHRDTSFFRDPLRRPGTARGPSRPNERTTVDD